MLLVCMVGLSWLSIGTAAYVFRGSRRKRTWPHHRGAIPARKMTVRGDECEHEDESPMTHCLGRLFLASPPHYCLPPMVKRPISLPKFNVDDPDPKLSIIEEVPPAGSVWRCSCGMCWESKPKRQYVNLISFGNEWVRCTRWRYRRQSRRLGKTR